MHIPDVTKSKVRIEAWNQMTGHSDFRRRSTIIMMMRVGTARAGYDGRAARATPPTPSAPHPTVATHPAAVSHPPAWSADAPTTRTAPSSKARRPRVHMHPAKRRLLLVVALGSLLGCVLMVATMRMVIAPLQEYGESSHTSMAQLSQLSTDVWRLRNATVESTQRMKHFLHQLQKLHAASSARTGLVEKAAAQSYREHARDRLREHTMVIKEGILLQTSQRRRIEDARLELGQMNLTDDLLLLHVDPDASLEEQAQAIGARDARVNALSASSSLAKSIREIRVAMLEHSVDAQNATADESADHVYSPVEEARGSSGSASSSDIEREHGILAYMVVFGVVGLWLWNVVTDERTRKASLVFETHRSFLRALGRLVVVERVDESTGEEDSYMERR